MLANAASRVKTAAKRKMIKEEDDDDEDAVRALGGAMKRARQENINRAL